MKVPPAVSLVLLAFGAVLVLIAIFNRVPRYTPPRAAHTSARRAPVHRGAAVRTAVKAAPRPTAGPRLRLVPARLTEQGRALFTALGGSAMIIASFLALSGY